MIFWFNSIIPKLLRVRAICLFPFVFCEESCDEAIESKTVLHELVHCAQITQYGVLGFYIKYLKQWRSVGYDYYAIPLEKEAFALQEFKLPKKYSEAFYGGGKFVRVSVDKTLEGYRELL
jgi:hypothetical protein